MELICKHNVVKYQYINKNLVTHKIIEGSKSIGIDNKSKNRKRYSEHNAYVKNCQKKSNWNIDNIYISQNNH